MPIADLTSALVDREVRQLFKTNPSRPGKTCRNPVTGGFYEGDYASSREQRAIARRALEVRLWHARTGPADAQPLPISARERSEMELRGTPLHYILTKFARSVEHYYLTPDLNVSEHPPFLDYVAGVLWEDALPAGGFIHLPTYPAGQLEALKKRVPPKMLPGMSPGATWLPPTEHREAIESLRRCSGNPSVHFLRE
jgi:hypothetical protein